jgi:hypothetical protein
MNQFNNCNCTYLTPPRFNEVHVPSQKCEQSCIMYVLWVLMLPLFLWLWNCSDRVSFCSLYHTLKMKLALQRIVVAFILYAWIKTYHFKRMKYFYLYVVYNKWNWVRTTRFLDTLYQVSKHCYNVILYITSSIDAPYSYWQISQSVVVVFSNLFWRVAFKPLNDIVLQRAIYCQLKMHVFE